jgi:membrane-bound lytic murein transglycosylase F
MARCATSLLAAGLLALGLTACGSGQKTDRDADSVLVAQLPDTLRVATLYSPTSYFIYREERMGYDYSLVNDFTREKGIVLDLTVAASLERAVQMLDSGLVDVVAYEVPVTAQYNKNVVYCGPESQTSQVLVQPRANDRITDVTELVGRDVYVEKNSKYQQRLNNLNSELGGGINIHAVDRDTLITEDLLEMVSKGEIPLTVVDSDIASLNKTYYPQLDITLELSFKQRSQWAVAPDRAWLADSINAWFEGEQHRQNQRMLYKRYFELSKVAPAPITIDLSKGKISPYDNLFKQYAKEIGWDWRLIAAQGFVESRFDSSVVSWAGARGIMQIMPGTARANGVDPAALINPETSIRVAVKILQSLDRTFAPYVSDKTQRQKFIIAAYNSGGAHILDAIALAQKYGRNAQVWTANVEDALLLKAHAEYYNDPVCKYGYFRGRQTVEYVNQVMSFYQQCVKQIKR